MISIDKTNNRANMLRVGCNAMVFKLIENDRKYISKKSTSYKQKKIYAIKKRLQLDSKNRYKRFVNIDLK